MSARRAFQRRDLPTNVAVGSVFAVIAVVASALVFFLLYRLNRRARFKRNHRSYKVDLLSETEGFIPRDPSNTIMLDMGARITTVQHSDAKPLPQIPGTTTIGSGVDTLDSRALSRNSSQATMTEAGTIRAPQPALARTGTTRMSRSGTIFRGTSVTSAPTSSFQSHSSAPTAPSVTNVQEYEYSQAPLTSRRSASGSTLGQLTTVNLTDLDVPRLEQPRLPHNGLSLNTAPQTRGAPFPIMHEQPRLLYKGLLLNTAPRIRGKDAPFPIMPRVNEDRMYDETSALPDFHREKQEFLDTPTTPSSPYMVPVPGSPPTLGRPPPKRARSSIIVTVPYPVSNVVVEDVESVPRPDGSTSKGRMVTMSVLVADSDTSSQFGDIYEDIRGYLEDVYQSNKTDSQEDREVVSRFGALPPYTPVPETSTFSTIL
ncbi:hypothetical protein K439DRAFT_1622196 [Ramaria rubella]|nr:hypothetical protein K439DRAFT_1622196 [Ramaria rubella]